MRPRRVGPWYRTAALLLEPSLTVLTRRDWRGQEHLPRAGGVVLCANHLSYADPLVLAHFVWARGRAPRFLAKSGLFQGPLLGRLMRGAGQIPVQREGRDPAVPTGAPTRAYDAAVDAVHRGELVIVYPDGTLTRDPGLWPMRGRTGAARIALATGAPVVPVAQWGAQDLLAPYGRRPRLLGRTRVVVAAGAPVPLDDLRGRGAGADVLDEATERIVDAVTALLAGIRGEAPPAERYDPRSRGVPGGAEGAG